MASNSTYLMNITTSVRLAAARPCRLPVPRQPAVKPCRLGIPGEALVVRFTGRNNTARFRHPPHLFEDADGVVYMLENLVTKNNVKLGVRVGKDIGINSLEDTIRDSSPFNMCASSLEDAFGEIDACYFALGHELGQVCGDCPRSTSHIENGEMRL